MVGIPGSGKSTWIQNHKDSFEGTVKVVSRDEIRFSMLKDDEDYFAHEDEVYDKFINEIKDGVANYDVTIADATHTNINGRTKLFKSLGNSIKDVKVIAMIIRPSLNVTLAQNEQREGRKKVPRGQIRRYYFSYTKPTFDERFDEIWTYKNFKYEIEERGDS